MDIETLDITHERKMFKSHLIEKCQRLKEREEYADREILDEMNSYRNKISVEAQQSIKYLAERIDNVNTDTVFRNIQRMSADPNTVIPVHVLLYRKRNHLIKTITNDLNRNAKLPYMEKFNEYVKKYQDLIKIMGGENNDISWFGDTLKKALSAKREKTVKEIEWQVLDEFISEMKKNGVDAILSTKEYEPTRELILGIYSEDEIRKQVKTAKGRYSLVIKTKQHLNLPSIKETLEILNPIVFKITRRDYVYKNSNSFYNSSVAKKLRENNKNIRGS